MNDIEVPGFFESAYRPDVILKAVNIERKSKRHPYGPAHRAGIQHSVSTWGKGRGVARVQRLTGGRTGAESPNNVGGRRAHPPRPAKKLTRKMNKKEEHLALMSALAATANKELVSRRGHRFDDELHFPIVVEDDFEDIQAIIEGQAEKEKKVPRYTGEMVGYLKKLGIGSDLTRAKEGKKIRPGKGKMRGRPYKSRRSVLIVASESSKLRTIARNIPGVEVKSPSDITISDLAPGGAAGRLTIYTQKALSEMEGIYEK